MFRLELLTGSGSLKPVMLAQSLAEARELTAIFSAAYSAAGAREED